MRDQEDYEKFVEKIRTERRNRIHNPKKVVEGDVELLLSMEEDKVQLVVEHIKSLPRVNRVEAMRKIVDKANFSQLKHPYLERIFVIFKSELDEI